MENPLRKYVAEFIGTFALVLIGTSVAVYSDLYQWGPARFIGISFAFGGTLMVLVLAIGPVSGCHVNPAVTLPMALAGRMKWKDVPGYLIAQIVGAVAASLLLLTLLGGEPKYAPTDGLGANGFPESVSAVIPLLWEIALTALFLFTIFAVTRSDAPPGFAALAIGGFLFVAHLVGAQLGDSSLNPARSFGPAVVVGGSAIQQLWVFVVGPFLGGIAGCLAYMFVYNDAGKAQ